MRKTVAEYIHNRKYYINQAPEFPQTQFFYNKLTYLQCEGHLITLDIQP